MSLNTSEHCLPSPGNPMLSQIDSNEIFRTIWQCALVVYFGGRLATLSLVARLISLRLQLNCLGGTPARVGWGVGGFAVCLRFKDGPWLIFLRQKQRHETHRETERERGGGAEQDSPAFLSSLVSDCTDAGHLNAAAAANTWQPDVWISEDNACY